MKTGVRGLGFVRTDPRIPWPAELVVKSSAMTEGFVARIERVTHRYGKTIALNDLALDIPAHCMAGLIGPDGVGKSTLLALISGVRKIQSGEVVALDGNMADERPSQGELRPHRLHAAGTWPQSLSDAQRI